MDLSCLFNHFILSLFSPSWETGAIGVVLNTLRPTAQAGYIQPLLQRTQRMMGCVIGGLCCNIRITERRTGEVSTEMGKYART